ncbi:MAG: PAS domain-containing protein, partial [Gemmatimonadota bacterium]
RDPVVDRLTCHEVSHHRDTPCPEGGGCPCPLQQVFSTKSPVVVTHTHSDASGDELQLEIVAAPIFDENGEVVQVIEACRNVTARVRAEELARQRQAELAHVARLGTMGEMAAGLAHELNQPLAAIVNYVQACLERMKGLGGEYDELRDDMEQAAAQAERAGEIIEHVRNFVRKGEPERTVVDFNKLVEEAVDLLRSEMREHAIQLRLELDDSLPAVMAEAIQLEQVIVNLMRNSLEAMSENGGGVRQLTIQTSRTAGGPAEFAIRDTGPGLRAEAVECIFDTFFTTKADGMGMGLPISRSIIEAHGGRLWAVPNPDRGVTFRFTVPIIDQRS